MKLRALLAVPLLLLVGAALEALAQACTCEGGPRRRTLAVNVLDEQGNQVSGLTAANFRAEFRGQPVEILSATLDTRPRRIVLLLDTSGSMAARVGKWELAAEAAEDLLGWGPPDSVIALVTFREKVEPRTGFESESQKAKQALKAARPAGDSSDPSGARTALRDAVVEAARRLSPARAGDVIYLITDGFDTFSQAKDKEVEAALLGSGARLFAVVLADRARGGGFAVVSSLMSGPMIITDVAIGESGGFVPLRSFVDASGGLGMTAGAVGTSAPRFDYKEKQRGWFFSQARLLYGAMGEFYRLQVELPEESDKVREWKLNVVDARGKKMKQVGVVYPRKLAPCGSDQ